MADGGGLKLARRVGETILIGTDIRVSVSEIGRGRVWLTINAPPHFKVDREEWRQRKDGAAAPGDAE